MIDFEHVSKEYKKGGRLALEDINLHVDDGEFVFLLGHSGAGKSTLLKLILREELPTSGKVTVLGKDVAHLRRRKVPYLRRQMGIIFQDFRLIPSMTVYENIAFAMHVTNVKRSVIRERVEYMLELVHLEDKAKVYPDTLSGGEQQRASYRRRLLFLRFIVLLVRFVVHRFGELLPGVQLGRAGRNGLRVCRDIRDDAAIFQGDHPLMEAVHQLVLISGG